MRPKQVFELSLELAERDRAPRRRGHPWVYEHSLYVAILDISLCQEWAYFGLTYRDTVAALDISIAYVKSPLSG